MSRAALLRPGIASRLLRWSLVLSLVPLGVAICVSLMASQNALREKVTRHLISVAEHKANQIETYALERKRDVSILAGDPVVLEALQAFAGAFSRGGLDSADYTAADSRFRPFLTYYQTSAGYADLFLISANGDVAFSVRREEDLGSNLRTGLYRDSVLAGAVDRATTLMETELSDFEFYPPSNGPAAFIAAPVFDQGVAVGVVALQISNEELYDVVRDYTGLGDTGEVVAATRHGDEAVFSAPLRHEPDAAFRRKVPLGSTISLPIQEAVRGGRGAGTSIDYRGNDVLAAWRYLPSLRWGIVVKVDTAEAFRASRRLRDWSAVLGAVTLLVVAAAAALVSRSISSPILSLQHGTEIIGAGDLEHRVGTEARDEIGDLSRAFDNMLDRLRSTTVSRDRLVEEVSERKRAQEQLRLAKDAAERASQAKSRFLANMSHELRTPLNAIIGYSEMLAEDAEDEGDDSLLLDLGKIKSAGQHLLGLINDILDLSKIEAGKMELHAETFDVATMLRDIATTVAPLIAQRGNTLDVSADDGLGSMHSDLTRVRQVLFNLLSNSAKFTENGTISLAAERAPDNDGMLVFRVSDSGIGMTEEQVARVFRPFTQADQSTTRKFGGTGLGLTISMRFCQMLGGEISVASRENEGSTFIVTLPVALDRSGEVAFPTQDVPTDVGEPACSGTGNTVLVIDDDSMARDLIARALGKEGVNVVTADSGQKGLELARQCRPFAITLDVMMPSMDGWAVLSALKADPETADTPVIMETMVDDRNVGYALGVADYLVKPINRDRLVSTVLRYRTSSDPFDVLVVEDDANCRDLVSRTLSKRGCMVRQAENGRAGLDELSKGIPGVVLLDLMMPEMDGFEFVDQLQGNSAWREIPVIVLTAKDITPEDHARLNGYVEQILQKGACSQAETLEEMLQLVLKYGRQCANRHRAEENA